MAKWYERAWSGAKDVVRDVPILSDVLGLSSPEEIAAQTQQRALAQSQAGLAQAYQPYVQNFQQYAGLASALPGMQQMAAQGAYTPQMEQFNYNLESDPSYQFARQQGLDAVQARMAARGLTGSGRELTELAQYATGLASQYAPQMRQQAFNEYLSRAQLGGQLGQQRYAQQLGLAQLGLGALGTQTDLATQLAQLQSGITQQSGQVGAAARMAEAAQRRSMMNQGSQAAAMAMGVPPGLAPQTNTNPMTLNDFLNSEVQGGSMYGYRP